MEKDRWTGLMVNLPVASRVCSEVPQELGTKVIYREQSDRHLRLRLLSHNLFDSVNGFPYHILNRIAFFAGVVFYPVIGNFAGSFTPLIFFQKLRSRRRRLSMGRL